MESSLRAKRSNPSSTPRGGTMDCFVASLLAMTIPGFRLIWRPHRRGAVTAKRLDGDGPMRPL
jgi:hypothetical protein